MLHSIDLFLNIERWKMNTDTLENVDIKFLEENCKEIAKTAMFITFVFRPKLKKKKNNSFLSAAVV